jgi:CRP/FNR family cyclic AMP-dependent transcriptional regulator
MTQTDSGYTAVPKWHMVLGELAEQDRAALAARMARVMLPPHTQVFQQGEPSDRLVVVESGRVRVYQTSEQGHTFTQAVCVGGTSVGLAALVARTRRDTSAETIDACTLQVMPARVLLELMHTLPGLGVGVARLLATTAIESFARSEALVVETARVRLARLLVSLAGAKMPDGGGERQIDGITQEDLARVVGVSRTWVVLTLKHFEEQGLIQRHRRRIVIPDSGKILRFVARRSALEPSRALGA